MNQNRIEEIYFALLVCDDADRDAQLSYLCGDDKRLKEKVLSLLDAAEKATGFLSASPPNHLLSQLENTDIQSGEVIGPYQLLKELGHGGMGVVFLAKRADGQYQQKVAIKLLRHRFNTNIDLQRFKSERQILAGLEHTNIARLLDGGNTHNHQPYLVMEYIQGTPINEYCQNNHLTVAQILKLFVTVCNAVQHAHQNLIIHRDLKPANILVTPSGEAKLIDFGTAKLLASHHHADQPPETIAGLFPMTPEYAAPEQITGCAITTATDVYALGVILYELLTGQRPYELPSDNISSIVKTICEVEAKPPSRIVSNEYKSALKGELDSIILRCLQKQPKQRYEIVALLIDDIRHYMGGKPVIAYKQSLGYCYKKYFHRHKWAVTLTSVFLILIASATIISTWQWQTAQKERFRAENRYNDVRKLANSIIFEVSDELKRWPGSTSMRKSMLNRGIAYLDKLIQDSPNDKELMAELAEAYYRLATIQGNILLQNLGDTALSLKFYEKSITLREKLLSDDPGDLTRKLDTAITYRSLSGLYASIGQLDDAQIFANKCVALSNSTTNNMSSHHQLIFVQCLLAAIHMNNLRKDHVNANIIASELERFYANNQKTLSKALRFRKGRYFEELAQTLAITGDLNQALEFQRKFVAIAKKRTKKSTKSLMLAYAYQGLGKRLQALSRSNEARIAFEQSHQIWKEQLDIFPEDVSRLVGMAGILAELASMTINIPNELPLRKQQIEKACQLFAQSEQILQKLPNPDVGYGARLFDMPDPQALRVVFKDICPVKAKTNPA